MGPIRSGRQQDVDLFGSFNKPIFAWSGGNGTVVTYTLTCSSSEYYDIVNQPSAAITVTDTLPAKLTATAMNGTSQARRQPDSLTLFRTGSSEGSLSTQASQASGPRNRGGLTTT